MDFKDRLREIKQKEEEENEKRLQAENNEVEERNKFYRSVDRLFKITVEKILPEIRNDFEELGYRTFRDYHPIPKPQHVQDHWSDSFIVGMRGKMLRLSIIANGLTNNFEMELAEYTTGGKRLETYSEVFKTADYTQENVRNSLTTLINRFFT